MGCKWFCFGSEEGNINPFIETSSILSAHQIEADKLIKQFISKGYSYPKASALAYQEIKSDYPEILSLNQPNNILGYHYVSTVMKHQLAIEPLTIKRTGSGYHDLSLTGEIASATGIRKEILVNENLEGICHIFCLIQMKHMPIMKRIIFYYDSDCVQFAHLHFFLYLSIVSDWHGLKQANIQTEIIDCFQNKLIRVK